MEPDQMVRVQEPDVEWETAYHEERFWKECFWEEGGNIMTTMKPILGPLNSLLYSRKALIATVDAVFSIVGILITYHLAPENVKEAMTLVGILQPLVLIWINAIATEDAARYSQ